MIIENLNQQIALALKARDQVRLSALRMLLSELRNFAIDKPEMTSADELLVVQKEIKKRKDAIEVYERAGRSDNAAREKQELWILEEFMPEQMSDAELEKLIDAVIAELNTTSIAHMGPVMGRVMNKTRGRADGARVSAMVKEKLA